MAEVQMTVHYNFSFRVVHESRVAFHLENRLKRFNTRQLTSH